MKIVLLLFITIMPVSSFSRHPVESLSIGKVTWCENSICIKVKCLEEGLRLSLNNFTGKNIVFDYDQAVFSKELTRVTEAYFRAHLKVTANNKLLTLKLKNAYWVEGTQASDHAAINVEVYFSSVKLNEINRLSIKNSLLMSVEEQVNILNLQLGEKEEIMTFKKGKETNSLTLK